jgi:phosphate transport system substrate-binding protein
MCHQRQPFAVCVATATLLSLLIMLGCNSKSDSDETFTVSASAPTAVMGAAGSTFIAPLMGKWVGAYQQIHPKVQINYRPIGSGAGIE